MAARIYSDTVEFSSPLREEWMDDAPCVENPDMFFPEETQIQYRTEKAKEFCNTVCTVRLKCLARALHDEAKTTRRYGESRRYGVFGGLSPSEREELQKKLNTLTLNVSTTEKEQDND